MTEGFFKIQFEGADWQEIIEKMLSFIRSIKGVNIQLAPEGEGNDNGRKGRVPKKPAK